MSNEEWRPIPGYGDAYRVFPDGRIYTVRHERFLKTHINPYGYETCSLWDGGSDRQMRVHRVLMLAFVGPSKQQVNHKDGNKLNNKLENLEYCSQQENLRHAREELKRGAVVDGISCRSAFDDAQVLTILSCTNRTHSEMARHYGRGVETIRGIRAGETYGGYHGLNEGFSYASGRGFELSNSMKSEVLANLLKMKNREICNKYGVSMKTIQQARAGIIWKDIVRSEQKAGIL